MDACMGGDLDDGGKVRRGGRLKLGGGGFTEGARVVFQVKRDGKRAKRTVRADRSGSRRLSVDVPLNALSGRIYVRVRGGRRTNSEGPVRMAAPQKDNAPSTPKGTPFDGAGMWVWELPNTEGGNSSAIASRALGNNVSTVFIKSGDGTNYWDQFSPELVNALKSRGLRVCAWQYIYGNNPEREAAVAAQAKTAGAECFVIDAETEYEGKYAQARTYVAKLREAVGRDYPVGLAGYPYVHYHPSYPYSAFFGDGGAQFNVPQLYWKEIGGGVDQVVETTYTVNRPYGRPIVPIGQTYNQPPVEEIQRFRQLVAANGSSGHSWWSWQETQANEWASIAQPVPAFPGPPPSQASVTIKRGNGGDLVLWAQEHLTAAGFPTDVDGDFGAKTQQAVSAFQQSRGLPATGEVDTATWKKLLEQVPQQAKKKPKTADKPARRNEIE
jgi:hypothetical protein